MDARIVSQLSDEEKANPETGIRQQFLENGFLVCRNFFSKQEMNDLLTEIEIAGELRRELGDNGPGKVFFYHNLYRVSEHIQKFCTQSKIIAILSRLIGPSTWLHWDHAVEKVSGGESFPWHQDNAYSELEDGGVHLWIAVSDSKKEHGGITFQRGSHKQGLLPYRKVGNHRICDERIGEEVALSCSAGDAVFFSSYILHRSNPNASIDKRWVYILEYMSQDHYNPSIRPPYFMVSDNNRPHPGFVRTYRGMLNPINRLKYSRFSKMFRGFGIL